MTTRTGSETLKYLGVEMLNKDADKSSIPEVGLFRGLKERSSGEGAKAKSIRLILLGTKDKINDIEALNLDTFNVLSIKTMYGETKELIVFKNNTTDQKLAKDLLTQALKEFREEKRMVDNDPEIIDISTFEDIPSEFFSPNNQQKKTNDGNDMWNRSHQNTRYKSPNVTDWEKKEAARKALKVKEDKMRQTPTQIRRVGDLPTLKILNLIKKKMNNIDDDEYVIELIDPDPSDTFDEKKS